MPNEIQQLLIDYLKNTSAPEGERALVYMTLKTDDQMLKMCEFLSKNPEATGKRIVAEAQKIAKE